MICLPPRIESCVFYPKCVKSRQGRCKREVELDKSREPGYHGRFVDERFCPVFISRMPRSFVEYYAVVLMMSDDEAVVRVTMKKVRGVLQ